MKEIGGSPSIWLDVGCCAPCSSAGPNWKYELQAVNICSWPPPTLTSPGPFIPRINISTTQSKYKGGGEKIMENFKQPHCYFILYGHSDNRWEADQMFVDNGQYWNWQLLDHPGQGRGEGEANCHPYIRFRSAEPSQLLGNKHFSVQKLPQ